MDDLISRQMAIETVGVNTWAGMRLAKLPAAQERKTGKWLQNINDKYNCSICGARYPEDITDEINFCPNCGAEMEVQ